jgi:uncharacterized protein
MEISNGFIVDAPIDRVWAYMLDVTKVAPCMPGAELTETVDDSTWKGNVTVRLGPVKMGFGGTVTITERDDRAHHVVLKADGREQRGRGAASALITTDMSETDGGTKVDFVTDLTITGAAAQYGRGMIQDISSKLTNEFADCLKANIGAEEAARAAGQAVAAPAAPAADEGREPAAPEAVAPEAAAPEPAAPEAEAPEAEAPEAEAPEPAAPEPAAPEAEAPEAPAAPQAAPATPAAASATPEQLQPGTPRATPAPAPPARTAKPVGGIRLGLWALWQAVVRFFKRLFGKGNGRQS